MSETVTVMNLTSRTIFLSSPAGMREEVLNVGDNRIPRAAWDYSVACSPSLGRNPKLFVVPEGRVERTSEPVSILVEGDESAAAAAVDGAIASAVAPRSLSDLSVAEAKRVIEQTSDLDALDAWTSDTRKAVSSAAQKRLDHLMVMP